MLTAVENRHAMPAKFASPSCKPPSLVPVRDLRMDNARETAMLAIQGLKCIYDTTGRGWAMEIALEGETASKRFDLDGPDDAEMLIEAFEDSSASHFDPMTGEISFAYEYAEHSDDEESEDDETAEADEDGDDEDDSDTKKEVA